NRAPMVVHVKARIGHRAKVAKRRIDLTGRRNLRHKAAAILLVGAPCRDHRVIRQHHQSAIPFVETAMTVRVCQESIIRLSRRRETPQPGVMLVWKKRLNPSANYDCAGGADS